MAGPRKMYGNTIRPPKPHTYVPSDKVEKKKP